MAKVTWDKAKETADSYKSGGMFLRLADDGEKFVGAFVGEPCVRELFYDEKTKTYEKYSPAHKEAGKKPSAKFSINVYQPAKKGEKGAEPRACRIFEMSAITFKDLLKVKEKYGLDKWMFEVSREGKKGSSKTTYHILPEEKLSAEEREEIEALIGGKEEGWQLHDLDEVIAGASDDDDDKTDLGSADKKKSKPESKPETKAETKSETKSETNGHTNGHTNGATNGTSSSGDVIAGERATELMARLKVRPQEEIQAFLKEFGVKKVKEVPAKDADRAFAFLAQLEGVGEAASDDPFA
jgi:hypothetical protein